MDAVHGPYTVIESGEGPDEAAREDREGSRDSVTKMFFATTKGKEKTMEEGGGRARRRQRRCRG